MFKKLCKLLTYTVKVCKKLLCLPDSKYDIVKKYYLSTTQYYPKRLNI